MSLIEPTFIEKLTPRQRVAALIAALVLLLVIVALIFWAYSGQGPSKKEDEIKANIAIANGQNAIIGNLVANQEEVVKNAEINTNKADNALRNSIAKSSNQFNGSGAGDRFCRDFANDSSCH